MICLRQNGLACLEQDLVVGKADHLACHIRITDAGFRRRGIFHHVFQVGNRVLQPVLHGSVGAAHIADIADCVFDQMDGLVTGRLSFRIQIRQSQGIGTHLIEINVDMLSGLRPYLETDIGGAAGIIDEDLVRVNLKIRIIYDLIAEDAGSAVRQGWGYHRTGSAL